MDVNVILNLKDHEEKSHKKQVIIFNEKTTIEEIRKKIKSIWSVDEDFQELFFHGNQILDLDLTVGRMGIQKNDELVVKHSELSRWELYETYANSINETDDARVENAKNAVEHHQILMKTGFFLVYIKFDSIRKNKHPKIAPWADGVVELMKKAAENYFRAEHILKRGKNDVSGFFCRFENPPHEHKGTHHNIHAYVTIYEEEETKYNLKCHHFGPSSSTQKGNFPDIKEIFCLKLLEIINVGPHVHFIHPSEYIGSRTCMYIASKWNDDFIPISCSDETNLHVDVVIQLVLLRIIFFMTDLNVSNCGHWKGTKNAAIVDFRPNPSRIEGLKKQLFDSFPSRDWYEKYFAVRNTLKNEEILNIAKIYLKKWDLFTNIDKANDFLIKNDKDRLKNEGINFKGNNSPTADLAQFLDDVRQNLTKLIEELSQ